MFRIAFLVIPCVTSALLAQDGQFTLHNGRKMPAIGLGVYMMKAGSETENAVSSALQVGYRMIDTAHIYQNEESVGKAIHASGMPRNDIFLATKLWSDSHGYKSAILAMRESIRKLEVDYVDLYLIHSPNAGKIVETWDALVQIQKMGLARSIGVSNFGIAHLEALEKHGRPLPVVNQVEMHPLNWKAREDLLHWCQKRNILVQAYGSMFFGKDERLAEDTVARIAAAKGKSPAQILLRWGHQMGFQLIPKSTKRARQVENFEISFELGEEEMAALSAMEGELGAYWQPLDAPVDLGDLSNGGGVSTEL